MRIDRIDISAVPYIYMKNTDALELHLKALVNGKEWTVVEILPNDHLISYYDRITRGLCERLKQMILNDAG